MPNDITPPYVTSVEIDRGSVNLDSGETTVVVTAHFGDGLSGVFDATGGGLPPQIQFNHSMDHTVTGLFDMAHPVSGDIHDGIFRATLTLPATAAAGVWTAERMLLRDVADNVTTVNSSSSLLAGLSFTVTNSHEDITPPELVSMTLSDSEIDLTAGEHSLVVTARFTDIGIGLGDPSLGSGIVTFVQFRSAGGQTVDAYFDTAHPISGTGNDGVFQAVVTLNDAAESGVWTVSDVGAYDQAGNGKHYVATSSPIDDLSFNAINAAADTVKPKFKWIEYGEPELNPDGTSTFKVRARFTDDASGLFDVTKSHEGGTPPQINFFSSTGQEVTGIFDIANPVAGDRLDGVFEATFTLGAFAEAGTWRADRLVLVDTAQNFAWFEAWRNELSGAIRLGSDGADSFAGSTEAEVLYGFGGGDRLKGRGGDDTLTGGDGDDVVSGGNGKDKIVGGSGKGDDTYDGGSGVDQVTYTSATKSITVDLAKHKAKGSEIGHDVLRGIEDVTGGNGGDRIKGDASANTLDGIGGSDKLTGGRGSDSFAFSTQLAKSNVDTITDFRPDTDLISLAGDIFKRIGATLDEGEFYARAGATKAHDKDDRIVYDTSTGKLYFDSDGKHGAQAMHFATLLNKPLSLDHGDFVMA